MRRKCSGISITSLPILETRKLPLVKEAGPRRELGEEFGVETGIGAFICSSGFEYKHFHIELPVYRARHVSGEFQLHDHAAIAWVAPADLPKYDLAGADIPVVKVLLAD